MATPYALKKASLQTSPKYSETEILRSEHLHCNSELDLSRDDRLRFAYATWCPVCESRQVHHCGSRRGKNEGLDADPLREYNRDFESNTDVHNCHKMLSKECDNCRSYDRPGQNLQTEQYVPSQLHRPNQFSEKHYPDLMDVDRPVDRPRLRGRPKAFSLSPVKKHRERRISSSDNRNHHQSYETGTVHAAQNIGSNDHPGHFYNALDNTNTDRSSLDSDVDLHGVNASYRTGKVHSCNDLEHFDGGCTHSDNGSRVGYNYNCKLHKSSCSQFCSDNLNGAPQQNDGRVYNIPENNVLFEHVNGTEDPKKVFHTSTGGVKVQYHREVEVLRSKLRELRSADKKRLRQRSESEPAVNYNRNTQDFSWEAKRARDNSPHFMEFSEAHQLATSYSISTSPRPSGRNAKLPPLPCKQKSASIINEVPLGELPEESTAQAYDSDFESGEPFCDESEEKELPADDDSEDDQSILSSLTTVSSDSNASAVVRESLGSISLNDVPTTSSSHVVVPPITKKLKGLPQTLRSSLFSFVPPFIQFSLHDAKGDTLPFEIQRLLKWKLSTITPLVVRRTLINTGFRLIRKSNDWCGTWGKHMKSLCFKTLKDFQKINHFPGTFQIGRKDRLWKNLQRLMAKFGKKEFGFIPRTFVLPQDNKLLRQTWEKSCGKERWIIKPPASARGTGIKVIHRWNQIPKKRPLVVQRYISRPYLINGSKFDLRLYVLVTSIHPLRIYLYDDGLVRFASVKYSDEMSSLGDRYMHLTNYSINKMSSQYTANEDSSACQGHKWTVKTLWSYLEKDGIDVGALKTSLIDLVIKTIISGESSISQLTRTNLNSRYASYELFGIDVLLDEDLKPWLLEVNISPSLHSSSPLDLAVKGPMVRDLMNMAGYQIPNKLLKQQQDGYLQAYGIQHTTLSLCFDKRLYTMVLSRAERSKQASLVQCTSREEYMEEALQELTPDDVRHLIQSEDELTQQGNFMRIFPTTETHSYFEFFESPRYYNMLFDAWETKYYNNRQAGIDLLESKCQRKFHLTTPVPGGPAKDSPSPMSSPEDNGNGWEDEVEEKPINDKKATSLSTISLYRAARPRSARFGAMTRQYVRSKYLSRKPKSSTLPTCLAKCASLDLGNLTVEENQPPLAVTC